MGILGVNHLICKNKPGSFEITAIELIDNTIIQEN